MEFHSHLVVNLGEINFFIILTLWLKILNVIFIFLLKLEFYSNSLFNFSMISAHNWEFNI